MTKSIELRIITTKKQSDKDTAFKWKLAKLSEKYLVIDVFFESPQFISLV